MVLVDFPTKLQLVYCAGNLSVMEEHGRNRRPILVLSVTFRYPEPGFRYVLPLAKKGCHVPLCWVKATARSPIWKVRIGGAEKFPAMARKSLKFAMTGGTRCGILGSENSEFNGARRTDMETKFCENCGAKMPIESKFCTECGTP
ncbi:MAG: zinc ribbon domain-containing protein, partial [Clostridia bacterium]|nr:zinc ribbon domain-containing protein [Clostridia bacterium]